MKIAYPNLDLARSRVPRYALLPAALSSEDKFANEIGENLDEGSTREILNIIQKRVRRLCSLERLNDLKRDLGLLKQKAKLLASGLHKTACFKKM